MDFKEIMKIFDIFSIKNIYEIIGKINENKVILYIVFFIVYFSLYFLIKIPQQGKNSQNNPIFNFIKHIFWF